MWEHEWKYHTVLYEGLVLNGQLIPPIIFTDCDAVPQGVEGDKDGKVIYLPEFSQPSGDMTLRWLEEVREYLEDEPLVVHDRVPEYMAKEVKQEMEQRGIRTMKIPATGGAFINPCDNAFNSQLKQAYYKLDKRTYEQKLQAILAAYYSPSEETMQRYFEHVGWRGDHLTKYGVQSLLSEGYRPGVKHLKLHEDMKTVYHGWKKNLRAASLAQRTEFPHRVPAHTWYAWD